MDNTFFFVTLVLLGVLILFGVLLLPLVVVGLIIWSFKYGNRTQGKQSEDKPV